MEIKDAYKQKMEAQLKEWNAQLNLLEAKAENTGADIKVKRAKAIHELRIKQRYASEKMKELGNSSGEAWDKVKVTADTVWEEHKNGIADAHSSFK